MNYALDHGIRIPEDLSIVGCGNLHYDDSLRVPLSSVDQHSRKIGEEAARIALRILNSKMPKARNSGAAARVDCARIDTKAYG
jgi:LacI family transcriptional regulator